MNAWAHAEAARMVRSAIEEEELRLAERDRRSTPRGGRRLEDLVGPEPVFRVVSGKCVGEIVPESDTVECDAGLGGCDGSGRISVRGFGEVVCPDCDGEGRVLGYPDVGPPSRVVRMEGTAGGSR